MNTAGPNRADPNSDQLELRQLRALVALAEQGSFTDAAIRAGTSQSAISRSIARLEAAVGTRLVERTTRTIALTPAGTQFYRAAAVLLRQLDDAVGAARGQVRPLRLGYAWAAFGRHTVPILRDWRARHPDVELEVHRIDERLAGLTRGLVDAAVVRGRVDDPSLHAEVIAEEGRLAALPIGHPLTARATLGIEELVADPIALTPLVGTTTLSLWPDGARPARVLEVDNIDEWLTAIASGVAVGVTPASTPFQHAHAGVVYVPLPDTEAVAVHLVWPRTGSHPRVGELAALVRGHMDRPAT